MEFTMSDDFDWDNPSKKAVLDIEVFTTKHEEDIWVEFEPITCNQRQVL